MLALLSPLNARPFPQLSNCLCLAMSGATRRCVTEQECGLWLAFVPPCRVHRLPSLCSPPALRRRSESPLRCRRRTFRGGTWSPALTRASRWVKSVFGVLSRHCAALSTDPRTRANDSYRRHLSSGTELCLLCTVRPSAHGLLLPL